MQNTKGDFGKTSVCRVLVMGVAIWRTFVLDKPGHIVAKSGFPRKSFRAYHFTW